MAAYHTDELTLEVPDDWVDRSINLFVSGAGSRAPVSVVVTRDPLGGEELAAFVSRQLGELKKKLPKLLLLGQRDRRVGPLFGLEARLQWLHQGSLMYQHQVYVPYYGEALIFTASSAAKLAPQCDASLDQIIASIKLRKQ